MARAARATCWTMAAQLRFEIAGEEFGGGGVIELGEEAAEDPLGGVAGGRADFGGDGGDAVLGVADAVEDAAGEGGFQQQERGKAAGSVSPGGRGGWLPASSNT